MTRNSEPFQNQSVQSIERSMILNSVYCIYPSKCFFHFSFLFLSSYLIMQQSRSQELSPASEKKTAEMKTFESIYRRKYTSVSLAPLAEKRKILASQLKSASNLGARKKQSYSQHNLKPLIKTRTQSIGSLLPKLRELQQIQLSQKQPEKQRKLSFGGSPLSKMDIYFSMKNIHKEQTNNMIFLTSAPLPSMKPIPDSEFNDNFEKFVLKKEEKKRSMMQALLNFGVSLEISGEEKAEMVKKQKDELKEVVRDMIQKNHTDRFGLEHDEENRVDGSESKIAREEQSRNKKNKNEKMNWIIGECRRYDTTFKVKKVYSNKSQTVKKILQRSAEKRQLQG